MSRASCGPAAVAAQLDQATRLDRQKPDGGLDGAERDELRELRRRPSRWCRRRRSPRNAAAFFPPGRARPGERLQAHRRGEANHPIDLMCRILGVSRSGFYAWSTRAPSDRQLHDAWLTEQIKEIREANRHV
jgi:hypothetical protein